MSYDINDPSEGISNIINNIKEAEPEQKQKQETNTPKIMSLWRHHSGTVYRVLGYTNLASTDEEKFPITILYRDTKTGHAWSRPYSRWHNSFKPAFGR